MTIQKWEFRHPLLVWTLVTLSIYVPLAKSQDVSCETLDSIATACSSAGGYELETSEQGVCTQAVCFGNASLIIFKETTSRLPPQIPEISLSEHPTYGDKEYDAVCMGFSKLSSFSGMNLATERTSAPLGKAKNSLMRANDGSQLRTIKMPFTLSKNRHGQTLECQMVYFENSTIPSSMRNTTASLVLYYFLNEQPKISGPIEVEILEEGTWECFVNQATYGDEEDFKVDFETNPVVTVPNELDQVSKVLNAGQLPLVRSVTTSLKFKVPAQLKPRFFLKCTTTNSAVNPAVSQYAQQLAIAVIVKPRDLTTLFNTVGICSGLGALILGVGLLYFYIQKKGLTPAPDAEDKAAAAADTKQASGEHSVGQKQASGEHSVEQKPSEGAVALDKTPSKSLSGTKAPAEDASDTED